MKHTRILALIALLLVSCGDDDPADPGDDGGNNNPEPQATAPGTPNGTATTETIGAAGGTISSSDGSLSIDIPAGALASDTDITIQPITNTAWGGIGGGYRLTPDGLTFSQPVDLIFEVAPEDLTGSAPAFMDVAFQTDEGFWHVVETSAYDDGAGTFTATTNHFTDYSLILGLQIRPPTANLGPGGTVDLTIKYCHEEVIDGVIVVYICSDDDDLAPLGTFSNWSVNGITGGNADIGRVVETSGTKARYTAPVAVPLVNPVAVSVEATTSSGTSHLISNITIGSGYHGAITYVDEAGNKSEWTVVWASEGALGGVESFTGTGTVVSTPASDPECNLVSYTPNSGPIEEITTYMTINRIVQPPIITVNANAQWLINVCVKCGESPVDCQDILTFFGFEDDSLATISGDGNTITGQFIDLTSPEYWYYTFTR